MFVIHKSRKGFIHIPRTAGRFIEAQCMNVDGFESIQPYHSDIPTHLPHYEWHTRVRDPIERIVSLWRFTQDGTGITNHKGTFDYFLQGISKGFQWHTRPQTDFITEGVKCWLNIEDCIHAMGGSITGGPINGSTTPRPDLTQQQIDQIKQLYHKDVELYQELLSNSK